MKHLFLSLLFAAGAIFSLAAAPASQPSLQKFVAPAVGTSTPSASYSVGHVADQTLHDLFVDGYRFGAVCESYKGGLTINHCFFLDSCSDAVLEGSGVYASQIPGVIRITDSVFGWSGRPRGIPQYTPLMYRHGWYGQGDAASPVFYNCIFVGNANSGVQLRNGGTCVNCLFIDNGTNVLAVMGNVRLTGCTILSSHLYYVNPNFTGGSAILAYNPVHVDNTIIVGTKGQCQSPPVNTKPAAKLYPAAAVVAGGVWSNHDHPPFVQVATHDLFVGSGNRIAGWPVGPFGGTMFDGSKLRDHPPPGFRWQPNPVEYDWRPVIDGVLAGRVNNADAIARVRGDLLKLIGN